jgi:hypothetical protein
VPFRLAGSATCQRLDLPLLAVATDKHVTTTARVAVTVPPVTFYLHSADRIASSAAWEVMLISHLVHLTGRTTTAQDLQL